MEESNDEAHFWWEYDLANEKTYKQLVRKLVSLCRSTLEYDVWQKRTKAEDVIELGCPICDCKYDYIDPETHHYPKTMFTIVADILQEHIENNDIDKQQPLDIVQEIMARHLANRIDYFVLCDSCHKKYHNSDPEVQDKVYSIWDAKIQELEKRKKAQLEIQCKEAL